MVGARFASLAGLAALSVAAGAASGAPAARVEFAVGLVQAIDAGGRARPVARGTLVEPGDTIVTHAGRAQLSFTDGGYVSLQPDTEFAIREYRFEGATDGTERGLFSLLKGAMRTVTGLVGRVNRDAYAVQTPTATIGIRGTGGLFVVRPDGGTLVTTTSGTFRLSNPFGTIELPAGTTGLAEANPSAPPRRTSEIITLAPPARPLPYTLPPQPAFVVGDLRLPDGVPAVLVTPAPPTPEDSGGNGEAPPSQIVTVRAIDYSYAEFDAKREPPVQGALGNDGVADAADVTAEGLKQFKTDGVVYNRAEAAALDRATDGLATWERWVGNAAGNGALKFGENGGLHVVYGPPTPEMPKVGLWTYTFTGGTRPTFGNESTPPGKFNGGTVQADFAQQQVGVNFSLDINSATYSVATKAPIAIQGAGFAGSRITATSTSDAGCAGECSAAVRGTFFGVAPPSGPPPGGGLAYRIDNASSPAGTTSIHGAAGFGDPQSGARR